MRNLAAMVRRLLLPLFIILASALPAAAGQVVRVVDVVDGDTVILEDGRRVRYLGTNTPERGEQLYQQAGDLNRSLVMGKTVRLEFEGDKDSDAYGRLLAYVYVGDRMANALLISEGMAHAFFIGPEGRHNAMLLRLQAEARQRGLGMWAGNGRTKELKITSVHPAEPAIPAAQGTPYVRIANLSDRAMQLAGYVLSDGKKHRFVLPDVLVEPGYTVIVSGSTGKDAKDERGQMVVHWPAQDSVWKPEGGTAHLSDPAGKTIDTFPYQGIRQASSRPGQPAQAQGKVIGNRSSMIYHLPGQLNYDRVREKNRVYFNTEEEAVRAGYRRAKR